MTRDTTRTATPPMSAPAGEPRLKAAAILQIATGLGIAAFWLLFFTVGIVPANPPACYFAFEHSFPPPDLILATALITSALTVLRGGTWGSSLALVCAGGLLFLGVIDLTFTAQNGGFSGAVLEVAMSLAISLWCIGFGLWLAVVHHAALQPSPRPA